MAFDFGKINVPKKEDLIIDPVAIFQKNKGKVTDTNINDLWLGQGDALREWNEHRHKNDIAIVLNTGAGKTLIGLLIAQSLVNETKGKVLYACGSIQLIEQTREKAESYGLTVTTYFNNQYSNDLFHQGKSVCLTTYQAIFNGKSVFQKEEIDAVIFDDAHTAESVIKNHFSLEIDRNNNKILYDGLTELFKEYYQKVGKIASFNELYEGQNKSVELLPPSIIRKNISEIYRLIMSSELLQSGAKFAWEHLKNNLDLCSFFVATGSIQIIPAFIPVLSLPYFNKNIRRIYLTATMLGEDAFIKTFGRELDYIVKPKTTAGECERLILFPGDKFGFENELSETNKIIEHRKSLILTANKTIASRWSGFGKLSDRNTIVEDVNNFKKATDARKLILTGRYDGIDLPGDTCRYMVLDGLPCGSSLFDKYLWQSLNLSNTLRSVIGCRIVQSLGRISRGMNDYGVVLISGKDYINWLKVPKNISVLPEFVQKQILLGFHVTESTTDLDSINDAVNAVITRQGGWTSFYEDSMSKLEIEDAELNINQLKIFSKAEVKFSKLYWERDFEKAALALNEIINDAFSFSMSLGAWYSLWLGYCYENLGDPNFEHFYKRAYGASRVIPKFLPENDDFSDTYFSAQTLNVTNEFEKTSSSLLMKPKNILSNLSCLDGSGTVNQIEEAIRCLGQYLGLDSSRPDHEHGTGPDNLWIHEGIALVIEAKTSKDSAVEYSKKYVGQLSQHVNWVKDNYDVKEIIPIFVGPKVAATASANPSDEMKILTLNSMKELSDKVISTYDDIANAALPINLAQHVEDIFSSRELVWPHFLNNLNMARLKDYK